MNQVVSMGDFSSVYRRMRHGRKEGRKEGRKK
jgi:hypothetical protein